MLTSLRIENFAIVAALELEFCQGMSAFTGETGAGKSIMIDALMLALGERADVSVIRPGADKCDIHACFEIESHALPAQWLREHDVVVEDNQVVLRRVIYAEGRSKSWINGLPFPLQKMKELSAMLVDIHGQHHHQTLLQHAAHREQLDSFAGHTHLTDDVALCYQQCVRTQQALQLLQPQGERGDERTRLLEYQLEELEGLHLKPGEMQLLHEEHQQLHHAKDYLTAAQHITTLLNDDAQPNVRQALNQALHWLNELPQHNENIKNAVMQMNSALIQCDETLDEMERFVDSVVLDPERLQAVEERISLLHQTARKYQIEASLLPTHYQKLQEEYQRLEGAEQDYQQLQTQYQQHLLAYQQAAARLRESRQLGAEKLAAEISAAIRQLGMPQGFIEIRLTPLESRQAHGVDKVEYFVCTNPGMVPAPLARVASGGELSRISLAIQMITARRGATPTLLFDEVDVGIGGATAALVGQLLQTLGERLQIFCVTHQPQVASCAHHHFIVEKYTEQGQTFSRVVALDDAQKVNEIARMLGGLTITEQSRSHARELLAQSH